VFVRLSLNRFLIILAIMLCPIFLFGQSTIPVPKLNIGVDTAKSPEEVSVALQILALLTVLSLAPTILILTTAFTRIVIILSFVRTALGATTIPPNQVIIGLSLFLTMFVMAPTYNKIYDHALKPYLEKKMPLEKAIKQAEPPLRSFLAKCTYKKDLNLFLRIRKEKPESLAETSMLSLIPAFIVSELKTAFVVSFYIFIPFLIIDLVVASVLMSMGMMMLPPSIVSLPAKILVFALADGWSMLISSLMAGYS
jgi:flagellar biosynthetic protein FliP